MGDLLRIGPENHFPFDEPFEIGDQSGNKWRGTWFYRSRVCGDIRGPFHSKATAAHYQDSEFMYENE